jgi:hypothetical protein
MQPTEFFVYIGTFQPLFVGKASTLSTVLYSAPKSEKAEYLLADFFQSHMV